MRKPKDRDFIETVEGMFFCVAGYLHPPDKITAYLKYSPTSQGKWKKGASHFRRELPFYHVFSVSQTIDYLKKNYPHYVHYCPVRNIEMSMVPRDKINQYYVPEERMNQLFDFPRDELEEKVRAFVEEIMRETSIPLNQLGITGSILIGLHNPAFSDIDLIVYGRENALLIKEVLPRLPHVTGLDGEKREEWIQHKMDIFDIDRKQAELFAARKWNYGFFDGTYFSLHPTRTDAEITETYGDIRYTGLGPATIRALITDSSESVFLPARYKVETLEMREGGGEQPVEEIISHEGVYCDVFVEGDIIEARGRLEKADSRYGLVLGSLHIDPQYIRFM
ncbi:MAG: nucleotidyltransferase domain-containing protein [Candidatus Methanofastidiosia archaeon]